MAAIHTVYMGDRVLCDDILRQVDLISERLAFPKETGQEIARYFSLQYLEATTAMNRDAMGARFEMDAEAVTDLLEKYRVHDRR